MLNVMLMAQPQEGQQGGGLMMWLLMWGLVIFIFYFLLIRPQRRKQQEMLRMLESLKRGDKVLTSSGIYGTVVGLKDNVAVLKIAEQVKVEFAKSAITAIVEKSREA